MTSIIYLDAKMVIVNVMVLKQRPFKELEK